MLSDKQADPKKKKSRAGRNLPAAIGSALALAAVVLVSLFTIKWLFGIVVIITIVVAVREFVLAFGKRDIHIARTPLFLAAVLLPGAAYLWGPLAQLFIFGLTVLAVMFWRIRRGTDGYVRDVTASIFVAAYLPFMAAFLMLTLAADNGAQRVLVFILLTVSNDIGGYAAGVFFGKHPIAAQISPKKSWEGFAGSVLVQGAVGAASFVWLLEAPWWQGVIAGIVLAITATAGDFAESAIKRDLGLKDMGNFLPGHGGMMDRLDSLIPNAFTSWALFALFLGTGLAAS
ncbi:MAG: phosphatidate cytidylyltransferase [Actinobacteria bacterium]|nr:phosphatidate cytidylyltransferase [Actinomycetota bacterium]MSX12939.1 phosphatidate cytidylyltransferase [Actinomycetota bacterium]MSY17454.1 phosphatidate cytidylyltransferase [Actinomycetota bacterium]MSY97146.1 phosphatidate cytidylyltransferase [Actinomycetota bacterium]